MIPRFTIFFSLFFYATLSFGQMVRYAVAAPYTGITAYSQVQQDAFSFSGNQAALSAYDRVHLGIYGERRFGLQELSSYSLAAALPTSAGNLGIQMNYAGFSGFNENKIGIAYAKKLGRLLAVGAQFNYYSYRVMQYDNAAAINFEGGFLMYLNPRLTAGIYTFNPVGGKLGKNGDEKLAGIYKFGLGYDVSNEFYAAIDIIKEQHKPVNVTAGFQYRFMNKFFLRSGFRSDNSTFFAGAGLGLRMARIDLGGSYHPQLGFSPALMLVCNFNKNGNE